jgi:cytochrome c oxidase subunit 2
MFSGAAVSTLKVNSAFFLVLGMCVFLLVLIMVALVVFLVKYHKSRHPESERVKESVLLEVGWTVVPVFLVLLMFYFGWVDFEYIRHPPPDSMKIHVIGRQWSWLFRYASGREDDVLRVPVDTPVDLCMTSQDVIHSFFVPAFRIKEDCVPGMTTHLWFKAVETGSYQVFCTEYCGRGHSHMRSQVIVLPRAEFDKWYRTAEASGVKAEGLRAMKNLGCLGCHTTDGSPKVGPTFKGLFGTRERVMRKGQAETVTVNADFVEHYIRDPNFVVVPGYSPIMPKLPATDAQIKAIVAYLETLK